MLVLTVQILSPVRFHTRFDYQTAHLYKQPHPMHPEPEILTQTHTQIVRRTKHTHALECYMCVFAIKMINELKKNAVCLRVVLRAAWQGLGDCGKVERRLLWTVGLIRGTACRFILSKQSAGFSSDVTFVGRFQLVCVRPEGDRWRSSHLRWLQSALPRRLLSGFVLVRRSTKKISNYHLSIDLKWIGQILPSLSSSSISNVNTPPALFASPLLCFHQDKHIFSSLFLLFLSLCLGHIFPVIQHTGCVVASWAQRLLPTDVKAVVWGQRRGLHVPVLR